jgi:3-phenylpropionate/trans-cinnamate dioxygenase ferredoxin reductase subunit
MADTVAGAIVILGAGLAGGNAAAALREAGFAGRVVLIGRERTVPFGRPPLSKTYLRGEEDLVGWYVKPAEWYEQNDVELRAGLTGLLVDTDQKRVQLDNGETILYERLAVCTGGRPRKPPITGIDLPGVHLLRTVEDCEGIKRAARPGSRAVVLGMGFIGAEVAASLRQLGVSVTAVFGGDAPLVAALGAEVGAVLGSIHREHGVELIAKDRVVGFEGVEHLERVVTEGGARIDCDFAVIGAGIEPDLGSVSATRIGVDNGILVDAQCRTDVGGVYAAGDVANHLHPLFGRVRVEHYNNAERMGRAVGRAMLGDEAPYDYVHTFWSDQYDDKVEYVGHVTRWDAFVVRGSVDERTFLGFYLDRGVLRAAVGFNRGGDPELEEESEMAACQRLVASQAEVPTAALADEGVDLRSLAATG